MKVFISKYALSSGITEHEAEMRGNRAYPGAPFASFSGFDLGKDAHETLEGAIAAADASRLKKIASVKKQLAKLERMTFKGARKIEKL